MPTREYIRCFVFFYLKDWSDLIEYVIHKFIKIPQTNTFSQPSLNFNITDSSFTQLQEEEESIK